MPNGTLRKNTQRQDAYVVMKPPTVGPITGATMAGQVIVEMARISPAVGVLRTTIARPTGTIMAPPIPCSTRVKVNHVKPFADPHKTEAAVKVIKAEANTVRDPTRSATH